MKCHRNRAWACTQLHHHKHLCACLCVEGGGHPSARYTTAASPSRRTCPPSTSRASASHGSLPSPTSPAPWASLPVVHPTHCAGPWGSRRQHRTPLATVPGTGRQTLHLPLLLRHRTHRRHRHCPSRHPCPAWTSPASQTRWGTAGRTPLRRRGRRAWTRMARGWLFRTCLPSSLMRGTADPAALSGRRALDRRLSCPYTNRHGRRQFGGTSEVAPAGGRASAQAVFRVLEGHVPVEISGTAEGPPRRVRNDCLAATGVDT